MIGRFSHVHSEYIHRIGKDNTWKIERKFLNFRVSQKTEPAYNLLFKELTIHDNVIGMYIENITSNIGKFADAFTAQSTDFAHYRNRYSVPGMHYPMPMRIRVHDILACDLAIIQTLIMNGFVFDHHHLPLRNGFLHLTLHFLFFFW